ncbi:MAG: biotin-independent malonate decarboxylase subunit beta [Lautropia sp.]|nr:biotin-independent malonate decarboxylase subunit beta [Lautropia sp.]
MTLAEKLLRRQSFIELSARDRAKVLLDEGSMKELLGPFERWHSPWLRAQGVVTQADDGVVIAKGMLGGRPAVVLVLEGLFQGGSLGEIGGAKLAGALELAADDNRRGVPTRAVIVFETGGVRLQEANLGLAAIAEIHAAIVDLRRYQPVIGISAGMVGCFGGMSIAAGLCSYLILTKEARLGLNGPQVIEQEAGIDEYDASDRVFVWRTSGGEQRVASGLADSCVEDDVAAIRARVLACVAKGIPAQHRSDREEAFLACMEKIDMSARPSSQDVRRLYQEVMRA